ncbi:uncharacterized protein LOC116261466 [Nymphaea colorata]|nr:uncharacterized protein LOC116261466 [Nymphaea colorata]
MRRVQGLSRPLLNARLLRSASPPIPSPAPSSSSLLRPPPSSWLSRLGANSREFLLPANGVLSSSFATAGAAAMAREAIPSFSMKELVLYQYAACPFCNKVRAFLDYNKLPYKVVEVNPISKKEIKWSEYKKVPVVVLDGKQLNDSFQIIETLQQRINPTEENSTGSAVVEEKEWCRWVDNHLVHVLAPNIYRSPSEALESFDYITTLGNFTTLERWTAKYAGAAAMYLVSKKLKKKHNITDERAALYAAANTWIRALNDRQFMGRNKPNLADLSVFGVLRPIWKLQSGMDLAKNTGIGAWYKRMETEVGESSEVKD